MYKNHITSFFTATHPGPFFSAAIVLEIPNITMKPSTDDIQQILNKCAGVILKLSQNVYEWKHHKLLHQIQSPVSDENSKGWCASFLIYDFCFCFPL